MAEDRKKLIEVQDLVVRFGSRRHAFTAVDNVSFHIYQGETFGLVGESGSGKTTIGRAIIRIHPTAGGKILFDGKQINGRISKALDREVTQRIQMIFQDPMSSLNERAKVDYIVSEGLYAGGHHLSEASVRPRWQAPCLTWVCCRNLPAASPMSSPAASVSESALPGR